jgi:WD40 repeat protein
MDDSEELRWESVYIFISSTFNDMHAERDYLVKRVFPELSAWCEERKLRLVDIDLRWGVTEADSEQNKRAVEICLSSVDRCRPFFLCFLGQRRGWVPEPSDLSESTLERFPKLRDNLGRSVTELEVMHALIDPMSSGRIENGDDAEQAFFYLRTPEYLGDVSSGALRSVYTNEGAPDPATAEAELRRFRDTVIPGTGRPCHSYSATWDDSLQTPELSFALVHDEEITRGRLRDFTCEGRPLADSVIEELKEAITSRFGERQAPPQTPLQKELEDQAKFLYTASESFIERENDFSALEEYLESDETRPLLIAAEAGMGKTSFLAQFVRMHGNTVRYRFAGRSDEAGSSERLAASILSELAAEGRIKSGVPRDAVGLQRAFPQLVAEAAGQEQLVLVIDALDQLTGGPESADFILRDTPPGVKLIVSVKTGGSERFVARAAETMTVTPIRPFDVKGDRRHLVNAYLSNYLKQLDDDVLETLISAPGSENPLFLKVVLSELRVLGVHRDLKKMIEASFGMTPESAFQSMLSRLERDPVYCAVPMRALAESVFGWLSHARSGMSVSELAEMLVNSGAASSVADARDAVNMLFRQMRPYLGSKDGRTDYFFEAFRTACARRYEESKPAGRWHADLAAYFAGKPMSDSHRLTEQAFQYARAGLTEEYLSFVSDADYVENRLRFFGADALAEDCSYYECPGTRLLAGFYRLCSEVLQANPEQLASRLFGHLSGAEEAVSRRLLDGMERKKEHSGQAWLKPAFECYERPGTGSVREFRSDLELGRHARLISGDARMVMRSGDHQLVVWDIERDEVIKRIGTDEYVRTVESAPDGTSFAAILGDNLLRVWDAATFKVRCDIRIDEPWLLTKRGSQLWASENEFAYTCDSRAIVIKDVPGLMRLFDAGTGQLLSTADYGGDINAYGIGESGLVVVGCLHPHRNDDDWHLPWVQRSANPLGLFDYDTVTGQLAQRDLKPAGHDDSVACVAASPDGTMAASADSTGSIRIWDTRGGECLAELPGRGSSAALLRFQQGGATLLAVSCTGSITVYDTRTFTATKDLMGFGPISGGDVFQDDARLIVRTGYDSVRLVDLGGDPPTRTSAGEEIRAIGIAADRDRVVASSYRNYIEPNMEPTKIFTVSGALHFFDAENGAYTGDAHLHGCHNLDFVYVDDRAQFVVSKTTMTLDPPEVRFWAIDEDDLDQGGDPAAESFRMPEVARSRHSVRPNDYRFSSHLGCVCACDSDGRAVHVYRSSSGRLLGRVELKSAKKMEKRDARAREFETTPDGSMLYALYPEAGLLELYGVAKGKRLFSKELADFVPIDCSADRNFNNDRLSLSCDGKRLLYASSQMAVLIDIDAGRVVFRLDRREEKPGEEWRDADTFASLSDSARFLALSRAMYGENVGADDAGHYNGRDLTRTDRVEVWDMLKGDKVADFYSGGRISNIIAGVPDGTFTFGLSNGRICKLALQNYV